VVEPAGKRAAVANACCAELGVRGALSGNCGTPSVLTTGSGKVGSPWVRKHAASSRRTTIALRESVEVTADRELPQLVRAAVTIALTASARRAVSIGCGASSVYLTVAGAVLALSSWRLVAVAGRYA
jgi:hypothetical protein